MWTETVRLGEYSFPFACVEDPAGILTEWVCALDPDRVFLVTDETVAALYGARFETLLSLCRPVSRLMVNAGEDSKTMGTVERLCEAALACGASKRSVVFALGGGVVGNIAGMVAGLLFRGIRLVHVPTTLLAASDSVISLKQAVNSGKAKNSFGLYVAPSLIIVDVTCFNSLPRSEVLSGIAELAKNAIAIAPASTEVLIQKTTGKLPWRASAWAKLVRLGLQAKLRVMFDDPFERSRGLILEYGHTVGHAIERVATKRPANQRLNHGECVVIGMRAAARVAQKSGVADADFVDRQDELLRRLSLMTHFPKSLTIDDILECVAIDNKRGRIRTDAGECAMILLRDFGRPFETAELPLTAVPLSLLREAIEEIRSESATAAASALRYDIEVTE